MTISKTGLKASLVRSGVLAAFLLALFPLMLLALVLSEWLPTTLGNFLFFAPQLVFPTGWHQTADSSSANEWWSFPIWTLVVLGFGWATRTWSFRRTVVAALITLVLVAIGLHLVMPTFGLAFELDGS